MPPQIYILSGPVNSGKTTTLLNWSQQKKDVFGILTPKVDGERMFMDVHSGERFPMQTNSGDPDHLQVGRYLFSKASFEKAKKILRQSFNKPDSWTIIDEIGPLELRGEGFHEIVREIVDSKISNKVILVIRDSILQEAVELFGLQSAKSFTLNPPNTLD